MSDDIKTQYAREAARLRLREMLATKKRGDRITASEVAKSTGFTDWRSFGAVIRTWATREGFAINPVPNDGWRLGLPAEHLDASERLRRSARKKERRSLDVLIKAPAAEMSEPDNRRREFALRLAANRVQQADAHDSEIKREFRLAERVPLRVITEKGGKE
ncbi:MAG: hypothetical protein H0U52_06715 [Chloroflexi bacterium]|nr:hypothetical protein [Chloroflexota bacterium]